MVNLCFFVWFVKLEASTGLASPRFGNSLVVHVYRYTGTAVKLRTSTQFVILVAGTGLTFRIIYVCFCRLVRFLKFRVYVYAHVYSSKLVNLPSIIEFSVPKWNGPSVLHVRSSS